MRWIILALTAVAGIAAGSWYWFAGDEPDLLACEAYIRTGLSSADGYHRIDVTRSDTQPLTFLQFKGEAGRSASAIGMKEVERLQDISDGISARSGTLQLRLLTVTYSSWAGIPLKKVCAFRLLNGELEAPDTLMSNAGDGHIEALKTLAILQGRRRPPKPKYACCL